MTTPRVLARRFQAAKRYVLNSEPVPHPRVLELDRQPVGQLDVDMDGDGFASRWTASEFHRRFQQRSGRREHYRINPSDVGLDGVAALYALVRRRQPRTIVETGVSNGLSTWAMLQAIADASLDGRLVSIDQPSRSDVPLASYFDELWEATAPKIPADCEPGWLVPQGIRDRWTLVEGPSQRELPRVLDDDGPIDLFVHDSQHDAPCQLFELECALEHLADGGWLVVDDVGHSDAFYSFAESRPVVVAGYLPGGMGVLRHVGGGDRW